jgi:hypothetical protein
MVARIDEPFAIERDSNRFARFDRRELLRLGATIPPTAGRIAQARALL